MPATRTDLPATPPSDGTSCNHEGQTSTYCTRCWANLYDLRQQHHDEPGSVEATDERRGDVPPADQAVLTAGDDGADDTAAEDTAGDAADDASLNEVEQLLRSAVTNVGPRTWFWLSVMVASHLAGYPVALAFVAAILDALFFFSVVWQVDFYEEEPWRLVERTFFWGALPAILLALIGEVALGGAARFLIGSAATRRVEAGFVAPIVEELCKGAVLVTLFRRHRDEFDGMLDGLLYGALVGLGFSMTENLTYYLRAQPGHLTGMTVGRGMLFGMNHACFSACFGFGLGIARNATSRNLKRWAPVAGLAAAIALHMSHNLLVTAQAVQFRLAAIGLAGASVFIWFRLVTFARTHEARWIETELADEVQHGVMTVEEAAATVDPKVRMAARGAAFQEKTFGPANACLRFYALATELAFAKRNARIAPTESQYADRIGVLRHRVGQIRVWRRARGLA